MGNLTKSPEIKYTTTGTAVCNLYLAVNERFKTKDGEQKEVTVFVDVIVYAKQAENCNNYLSKGSPVFVEGKLILDQWENQQGEKRSKLRVRADRVQFLGQKPKDDGQEHQRLPQDQPSFDSDDIPF
jgi:single-strand DNA-binding protein